MSIMGGPYNVEVLSSCTSVHDHGFMLNYLMVVHIFSLMSTLFSTSLPASLCTSAEGFSVLFGLLF